MVLLSISWLATSWNRDTTMAVGQRSWRCGHKALLMTGNKKGMTTGVHDVLNLVLGRMTTMEEGGWVEEVSGGDDMGIVSH